MNKKIVLMICMLLLSVGSLSGCISDSDETEWSKVKEGVLINSEYHRRWWELPHSVDLYFSDATRIRINGDTENITRDVLYQTSQYYKGETVEVVYFKDTNHKGTVGKTRIVCISFKLVNKTDENLGVIV